MLPLEKKSLGKYILSLLITFSLPSQSVLPIYSSPLSCLLITSFLFLPSHSVLPISSSTLSCLLIILLYNPSCFLITSFLSPQTHYFVSSFTTFCPLLHLFLLLVSSSFFPVSSSLFPASASAVPISSFTSFRHCSHSLSSDPALY